MKRATSFLLLASAIGFSPLYADDTWAVDAVKVSVNLDQSALTSAVPTKQISGVGAQPDKGAMLVDKPSSALAEQRWTVINLPIEIKALGKAEKKKKGESTLEEAPARYVNELKVKAYVLFEKHESVKKGKGKIDPSDYFLLEKEITYVDIPMEKVAKKGGKGFEEKSGSGYAKMNVGLFLSPAASLKVTGQANHANAVPKVVACAIEPTFAGVTCKYIPKLSSNESAVTAMSYVADQKLKKQLDGNRWWQGSTAGRFDHSIDGAEMLAISETPYAPLYAAFYPATKPLFGSASAASSSSGSRSSSADSDSASSSSATSSQSSDDE